MNEFSEAQRLDRELADARSADPRSLLAHRVEQLAALSAPLRRDLLADARARAVTPPRVALPAARRGVLVAALVAMLGGGTVAVGAQDAAPGTLLHPLRRAGSSVVKLFTGPTAHTHPGGASVDPRTTAADPSAKPSGGREEEPSSGRGGKGDGKGKDRGPDQEREPKDKDKGPDQEREPKDKPKDKAKSKSKGSDDGSGSDQGERGRSRGSGGRDNGIEARDKSQGRTDKGTAKGRDDRAGSHGKADSSRGKGNSGGNGRGHGRS